MTTFVKAMPKLFEKEGAAQFVKRINQLHSDTVAKWGKMNVAQMLAHCAMAFEDNSPRPNFFTRLMIRVLVKRTVVGDKAYQKNMPTSSAFTINDKRDFEMERQRLIQLIEQTQKKGASYFINRTHPVFGKLSAAEWDNCFAKHLDHHLRQFGV